MGELEDIGFGGIFLVAISGTLSRVLSPLLRPSYVASVPVPTDRAHPLISLLLLAFLLCDCFVADKDTFLVAVFFRGKEG